MTSPITPELLADAILRQASAFAGMVEREPNARWDDPETKEADAARNRLLTAAMEEAGWQAPWAYCMGFAEGMVLLALRELGYADRQVAMIRRVLSPHVMTTVRGLARLDRLSTTPEKGALWLARHGNTDTGHAGIVSRVHPGTMGTVEGNTSTTYLGPDKDRQGDGIYRRIRNWDQNGNLRTMGFLEPDSILRLLVD